MTKPVVTDFLGNTAGLKAAVAEASASLSAYDAAVARSSTASAKLAASNDRWQKGLVTGAKIGAVGIAGIATALGGAAIAAASFDQSMRNVNSIAGLSQKGFKNLEAQVLRLSVAVGKSPKDLADGLYSIVSSGFKAQDAMKILTAGAKAARAGLTDTATATAALTAVLNAYHLKATDARQVSDVLFQAVNKGVFNFEQLSASLGKILPRANSLHVSLTDLMGAMAALSLQGNNADESATQLGQTLTTFSKPNAALTAEFKKLGYATASSAVQTLGFKGTLDALGKAANGSGETIAKWFPNSRAARGFLALEGSTKDVQVFTSSVKAMDEATKGAGETQKVYQEQQKSTAAQFDHLKAAVDVAAVTIGTALLPEINKGIGALSKWLAQAQKSGDLTRFAQTVASDVKATVAWLESLGPAASVALHVVGATFQTVITVGKTLGNVLHEIEPELEAIAHASSGLASALGPGVILGGVAAYLALNRAILTTQAGAGRFAQIMKAGAQATALAGGGAISASGRIDAVGKAAINAESGAKIFARGLVSSFGPQLLAVGAAGIVASILLIRAQMTSLKSEADDAVNAILHLNDVRLGRQSAVLDVKSAQIDLTKARSQTGSAAAAVASARASAPAGGHPNIADPGVVAALSHQRDVILQVEQAENRLAQAQDRLGKANTDLNKGSADLAKQFGGLATKADEVAKAQVASLRAAEIQQGRTTVATATAAQKADIWANSFAKAARGADGATAASIKTASGIAGLVRQMGRVPDKRTTTLIVDDLKAGRSVADMRKQLIALGLLTPTPKIGADTSEANRKIAAVRINLGNLAAGAFTVHVNEAPGTTGHFNPKGQWVYGASGGMSIAGSYGADDVQIRVTGNEVVLNPTQQSMVESGRYSIMGALAATGAPTIQRGGTYKGGGAPKKPKELSFKAFPVDVYDQRASNADATLKGDRKRLKTARDELAHINNEISKAHAKIGTAKTAKTRDSYTKAADALEHRSQARIGVLSPMIESYQNLLPTDTSKYQAATRAAKAAHAFADRIKRQQDLASQANSEMQLAASRWAQAKTPAEKAAQLRAYQAAQGRRSAANTALQGLLGQAQSAIGDTGSQYYRDTLAEITASQIDEVSNEDATQVPGYVAPDTNPTYLTPEQQYQLDRALQTDANGNPVDPGTAKYLLGLELANQQAQESSAAAAGNFALADQIVQDENNVRSTLASLSQPAAPTADLQAQLAQSQAQVTALTRGAGFQAAFDNALGQGGLSATILLGDSRSAAAVASVATRGFNAQPFVASNAGSVRV